MEASAKGHVEAARLLLDIGADVNAKDNVSTCWCTDVSVSLVCLSVCLFLVLLVCMLSLSTTIYTFHNVIIGILLTLVMVGWVGVIAWKDCSNGGLC